MCKGNLIYSVFWHVLILSSFAYPKFAAYAQSFVSSVIKHIMKNGIIVSFLQFTIEPGLRCKETAFVRVATFNPLLIIEKPFQLRAVWLTQEVQETLDFPQMRFRCTAGKGGC